VNADLQLFVRESLVRGIPRSSIADKLLAAGWPPEEITAGLAAWVETDFPVPIPRRRPYVSAREAFLYLVLFATLYTTAFNVGAVLFQWVDLTLPDASQPWESPRNSIDAVRGPTAGLIIAFPIFLLLARSIGRGITREPDKRGSKVRKWLTYLTLFVAAVVLIGDMTFLVTRILSGELPLRVLLKVGVVLAIAGTVFGHYLGELRRDESEGTTPARELRVPPRLAAAAVLGVLVVGLILGGSPSRERHRQLDARRIQELQALKEVVDLYTRVHGQLPATLDMATGRPDVSAIHSKDPVSGEGYRYRVVDPRHYQLCAKFDAATPPQDQVAEFWRHPRGSACFDFDAPPPGPSQTPVLPPVGRP